MEIVHGHGRVWLYDFNANKSGILDLGEINRNTIGI